MRVRTVANNETCDLQVFENAELGKIRSVVKDGEPWFVGKDVAETLGYKDTINALKTHVDSDDKMGWQITTPSRGKQSVTIINESGVYSLIFGSKLEKAKQFKHWVTSEVLPTLRKTKTYTIPNVEPPDTLAKMREETRLNYSLAKKANELYKLIKTTGVESHKNILVVYSANMLAQKEILELPSVERSFTATEVGKKLGISAKKVGMIANELHLKADMGCENEYGRWVSDVCKNDVNKQVEAWRYTSEGIEAIREYISNQN